MMRSDPPELRKSTIRNTKHPGKDVCYVYTHAYPNGAVFYVGAGRNYRAWNFHNRSPAHKGAIRSIGKENVVVTIYDVPDSIRQFYFERLMIERCLLDGALLLQHVSKDILKRVEQATATLQ